MPITPLPTPAPARTQTQTEFDAAYAAHIAALPTFVTEVNALAGELNATSGAGAIAIPYTFSTTTTDADPGNGILRLSSATQNASTVIRADLLGSDGKTYTGSLDIFDDSTNTIKGYIRLVHATNATKFLIFSVTSLASPTGYKNITVTNISSSAASPFANSDAIVLYFTRSGDAEAGPGDHTVVVHTGNGHGSTNNKIRRFTTAMTEVGTAITYADSATLGATFTINETGLYEVYYQDVLSSAQTFGISLNSAALTLGIAGIPIATKMGMQISATTAGSDQCSAVTRVLRLTATDVIRAHTDGALASTADKVFFSIRKVGL